MEKLICFPNFPIYTNNEMQIYYDKFLKLLEKFNNAKNIYFYYNLISTDKLPNVILVSFLLDSNIIILKNYNKLLNEISNFNSSPDIMSNVKQMAYDYSALKNRALSKSKAFESVLVAIFQNIVEMFDVRSKELLYAIIENHEKKAEKYIINLIAWCNFLLELKLGGKKIYKWRNWLQGNLNSFWNDYTIYGNVYNKIENPHQVHNWLHQFSLKCFNMNNCYLYSSYIDCFIKEINNFSDEPVVILRVNNDLIEISIPFGVHKSSFIIKKDEICIDFFEAPDTASGLHGRLVYYQNMLNVLNTSQDHFGIKSSIILTLGTPMIRISIKKYDCDYFNYKEIQLCYWIVRTLFDSSYDFSYVELNELNSVEQLLHEKTFWKTIFEKIIEYRILI